MAAADPWPLKALGGGFACMVTNPIDVLKTRLQLQGEGQKGNAPCKYRGFLQGGYVISKEEGLPGLYKGYHRYEDHYPHGRYEDALVALVSLSRYRSYELVKDLLGHNADSPANTPLWVKATSGLISGAIGAALANPTDLIKVRMQAAGVRYNSMFHAISSIYSMNGLVGFYKGVVPTTQRAALLTASQLGSYDHIKQALLRQGGLHEGILLHFVSSFFAGFIAAAVTSPVDVVKTRVMNQTLAYKSSWECVVKTLQNEGLLGFYKGFFPNWFRIAPHTVVTMVVFEQFRRLSGMRPV